MRRIRKDGLGAITAFASLAADLRGGSPLLLVLAGPNGSGKSTFYEAHIARTGIRFVNADLILKSLPVGESSYKAAELADAERSILLGHRQSFCMETVFSDPEGRKVEFLAKARKAGFLVVMIFVGLDHPELSIARVVQRVQRGGHDVPDEKLRDRFPRTMANLKSALPHIDRLYLLDNSSFAHPFRLVAILEGRKVMNTHPPIPAWAEPILGKRGVVVAGRHSNRD